MKRYAAALVVLIVIGLAGAIAVRTLTAGEPLYSVSQLDATLRHHPAAVVGRVIRVRGVVGFCPVRAGCPLNLPPVLIPHLGTPSADPPLQLDYGPDDALLASLRGIPLLGALVPARPPLVDGYQGVLRVRIEPTLPGTCYEGLCYQGVLQDKSQPLPRNAMGAH